MISTNPLRMQDVQTVGLRLAIYARVSTEEQREGQTIDSQIAELERFAREKGWQIVGTYKDDGWSGGVMARPKLDRLRDDAKKGLFQSVLINDVDRLARDVAHLGIIKRDLERSGVQVVFRKLPSDASPTHNLMVNILGSFAEFERELISDRTRRGRRHKVEVRKQYLGSNTSYGYRYTPKDRAAGREGLLEIVPEEASVVRQMFGWVDQEGLSARRVMSRLNKMGVPPRKRAERWSKSSVLRILRNEMYAGVWYYNKHQCYEPLTLAVASRYRKRSKSSMRKRPREEWLPLDLPESLRLLRRDQWHRVQQQLDRNIAFSPRNAKHVYLLKGLVRCGGCRARYVGDPCHGKFYYRCLARCKRYPTVREEALNETVVKAIEKVVQDPRAILAPIQRLDEAAARESEEREPALQELAREVKRIQAEEDRLLEAYRIAVISPAQLGQQLESLKARRSAIEARRTELGDRQPPVPPEQVEKSVRDYCAEAAQRLRSFTLDELQRFLRTIIRNIVFEGTRIRIQGQIPLLDSGASTIGASGGGPNPQLLSDGRIATTMIGRHGRNPGRESWDHHSPELNPDQVFLGSFQIATEIIRRPPPEQPRDLFGRFVTRNDMKCPVPQGLLTDLNPFS